MANDNVKTYHLAKDDKKRDRIVDSKDIIIQETTNNLSKDLSDFGPDPANLEFGQLYKSISSHILAGFMLPVYAHFLYRQIIVRGFSHHRSFFQSQTQPQYCRDTILGSSHFLDSTLRSGFTIGHKCAGDIITDQAATCYDKIRCQSFETFSSFFTLKVNF